MSSLYNVSWATSFQSLKLVAPFLACDFYMHAIKYMQQRKPLILKYRHQNIKKKKNIFFFLKIVG